MASDLSTDSDDEDFGDEEQGSCPFCGDLGQCEHMLLLVDMTFRTADGGPLRRPFADCWSRMCDAGDDDFPESEAWHDLLEKVYDRAEDRTSFDVEGGPGNSSAYQAYYCSSPEKVAVSVKKLEAELRG